MHKTAAVYKPRYIWKVVKTDQQQLKKIDIEFSAGNGGHKVFPVFYAVEDRVEDCMQIFRCTIGLPPNNLPAWLPARHFELITYVRDGMQLVDYGAAHFNEPHMREADAFRYKVYTEIFFREKTKRNEIFP